MDGKAAGKAGRLHGAPGKGVCTRLTRRQLAVLIGVLQGLSYKEIGHRLGISRRTVEEHFQHIKNFFGTRGVGDTVCRAVIAELTVSGGTLGETRPGYEPVPFAGQVIESTTVPDATLSSHLDPYPGNYRVAGARSVAHVPTTLS